MEFLDFFLPMLIVLVIGIIGVTAATTWMIAKSRYKDKLKSTVAPPTRPAPPLVPAEPHFLEVDQTPAGTWTISIQGRTYLSLEAVPNDAVRQDVVAGLRELATFARSYVQKGAAKPGTTPTPSVKPAAAPAPPAREVKTAPTPDRGRMFLKGETPLRRTDAAPVLMPSIDLAREIGDIVAEMQARIPSLSGRSIRLQSALDGGIQFAIDGIAYPDVASIPDRDIQALIRAATQEWESR